jgi:hypothetical protein
MLHAPPTPTLPDVAIKIIIRSKSNNNQSQTNGDFKSYPGSVRVKVCVALLNIY